MKKNTLKILIISIFVLVVLKVGYELKWFDVLIGVSKLETNKQKKVHKVSFKSLSFVTYDASDDDLKTELANLGWDFFKQYGRGFIFTKDGYEVLLSKKVFFGKYAFFEVAAKDVFDVV